MPITTNESGRQVWSGEGFQLACYLMEYLVGMGSLFSFSVVYCLNY